MPPNDTAPYHHPTPAEARANRLRDPTAHGLCVPCAAEGIEQKAWRLDRCTICDLNAVTAETMAHLERVKYRPNTTPSPMLAPPFRADGDEVYDRYDRRVCEVDPMGILYTDAVRREMAIGIADALNAVRGGVA
jgi:DNA-binding XRE family transcriptional regulator